MALPNDMALPVRFPNFAMWTANRSWRCEDKQGSNPAECSTKHTPFVFKTAQWWCPLPSSNSADQHGLAFCSWNPAPAWVEGKAPAGLSRVGIARSKSLQCSIKLLGKVIGFRQCFCIICPFGHREHSRVSCASLHPAMQPMALFPCQQPNHHQHLRG